MNNPPCEYCTACCCKQTTHQFAVLLDENEVEAFDKACLVKSHEDNNITTWALPYENRKCVYLGDNDRCKIYNKRPRRCREFNCVNGYKCKGEHHSFFLEDNPGVVSLIELHVIQKKGV